jgi:hypothetical protein
VSVTGKIVSGSDGFTPAAGTVTFAMPGPLYDTTDNVLLSTVSFTATLDGTGSFTISLPPTNSPNVNPSDWAYSVRVSTGPHSEYGAIQVPYDGGTVNFNAAYTPGLAASSGNTFVHASGGTMTGDLVLSGSGTDLTVGGDLSVAGDATVAGATTVTYQGVTGDIMRLMTSALSTGVASGGDLSPNANPAKLDITAMTGWIIDYNSSGTLGSTNPQITYVSLPAQAALTPTVGVPTGITWWLVDSSGTLVQQTAQPTPEQRRMYVVLGATAQVGGTIVTAQSLPTIQSQPANQLLDLIEALGNFRISGAQVTANGANLSMNLSSGRLFARAFSQIPEYHNPHHAEVVAETPLTFRHLTGVVGSASALRTTLDVGNYDPSGLGVVTAVPGGANTATNFRVWAFGTETAGGQVLIQYGQSSYSTLADAQAAIGATQYVVNPTATAAGVLLGWISVTKGATDLSNATHAVFVPTAGKFSTP